MNDLEERITRRSLMKRATGLAAALYGLDTLPAVAAGSGGSPQPKIWWTKGKEEEQFSTWLKANPRIAVIEPKAGRPLVAAVKDELLVSQPHLVTVIKALPKGVTATPTASLLLGNNLQGTAPAGSKNPKNDVILVRLTSHNKNAFEVLNHLHQTLPALAKEPRAVTPNHVLVPAPLDHSCPYGPPIHPNSPFSVSAVSSSPIDVTVIDAGYWWDQSWGQNPLKKPSASSVPLCTLSPSLAKIVDTSGHLVTPTSWEGATQLEPGGVLAALAGHANFVAGVVARGAATPITAPNTTTPVPGTSVFHPNIHLWNHPGAFYPPPTTTPFVDGFPTEFTVCVSILESQGYPSWSTLSSVIQIGFAYGTYSGQTGSYVGLPSVAWDVVFGLLTNAHQTKGDSWIVTAPVGNQDSSLPFYPAALATTVAPTPLLATSNAFANIVGVGSNTPSVDSFAPDSSWNGQTYSNYGSWVPCSANGSGVTSTFITNFNKGPVQDNPTSRRSFSGYATWNGTSFVSPKVAAAFAQVIAASPSVPMTPIDVIHTILPNTGSSPTLGVELNLW